MRALLLSGGMDSIALAYWVKPEIAITIDYGQLPAAAEIRASAQVALELGIAHYLVTADLSSMGSGDLAGKQANPLAPAPEWWPFRNQMLVTLAAMKLSSLGVMELMLGTVSSDSFHVDGSTQFVDRLDKLLSLQEGNMRVTAPAIHLDTLELIKTSLVPRELLAWSHSCHMSEFACGQCRGCCKHYNVTYDLGWDPN